ncbi:hypothetical protein BD324DRAFT_621140 [Kockovaella imperatae]|uniref:Lanthionine synthetase C-like protein n=1 Tax=Kockovaella imperatae TaxID=4999 RepID=A0A1Y1UKH9_9TREE|nr:hypothetical protein BD324DRAFT_621140 [Kockovaella imperatae]ORX38509.1 hypothetical protein BD324DRAFT_621140 [Kockovaella imperatae]
MSSATPERPRCLPNDGTFRSFDADSEIPRHASILVTRFPPAISTFNKAEDCLGFYSGPTSIAYSFFLLKDDLPPSIEGKSPIEWAKAYLETAKELLETSFDPKHQLRNVGTSFCGITCETLCRALTEAVVYDDAALLEPLFQYAPEINETTPSTLDEWVLGRAGYLYNLRAAAHYFPSISSKTQPIIKKVVESMLEHAPDSKEPWKFAGDYYLGTAHGWIGNLTAILLSDPSPERAKQLRPYFVDILRQQLPNGNWRGFADIHVVNPEKPKENREVWIQFGHGGPGFVCSFLAIRHLYEGDEEFLRMVDEAVNRAQDCIWQRAYLTKESSILHGAAGNSLALLDQKQKETLLAVSTQEEVDKANEAGTHEPSNSSSGLHRGLAGRIWAMVQYKKGQSGVFPTYNDL